MIELFTCLEKKFSACVISQCKDTHGCKINLIGISDYVILKPDKYRNDIQMCDCMLLITNDSDLYVVFCEIKSKNPDCSEIHNQLLGGVKMLIDLMKSCDFSKYKLKFYFLAVAKRWKNIEYKNLQKKIIPCHGKKYNIIAKKCGVVLKDILKEF